MVFSVCFPASAQVQLVSGGSRAVSNLKAYDQLLTLGLDRSGKKVTKAKASPFYTYLHFEKEATSEFFVLKCENGLELSISGAHLLFKRNAEGKVSRAIMAKNIEIGDNLLHMNENKVIENVKVLGIEIKTLQGVFAPLTKSGTLIVDGFLVSCYAHVDSHIQAHASMAPLRLWYQLNSKIGKPAGGQTKKTKDGIHAYAKTLASLYGLS